MQGMINTVVSDTPIEVEYDVWLTMTDQEKAGKHWIIKNAPAGMVTAAGVGYSNTFSRLSATDVQGAIDEVNSKTFVLSDQSLTFTGTTAQISDSRVTANTYATAYFTDATVDAASAAGIEVETSAQTITFTVDTAPSTTLVCDVVCLNQEGGGAVALPTERL